MLGWYFLYICTMLYCSWCGFVLWEAICIRISNPGGKNRRKFAKDLRFTGTCLKLILWKVTKTLLVFSVNFVQFFCVQIFKYIDPDPHVDPDLRGGGWWESMIRIRIAVQRMRIHITRILARLLWERFGFALWMCVEYCAIARSFTTVIAV